MSTKTDVLGNLIIGDPVGSRPRVLLYEPDERTRSLLERSLAERCSLRIARDLDAVKRELVAASADVLVVSGWDESIASALAGLPASGPRARVVHFGKVVPEALVDAAERGVQLSHVDTVTDLGARILALTYPRSMMERHVVRGLSLYVCGEDELGPFPLVEVSNDGFSFTIDEATPLAGLLPGALLDRIELRRGEEIALADVSAMVRHIVVEPDGLYRIGCEMHAVQRPDPSMQMTFVHDRALIAGMLRTALRGAGLLLQTREGMGPSIYAGLGTVDLSTRSFTLTTAQHALSAYDIVRGRFEVGGSLYRFTTSVMSGRPLTVRLPDSVEVSQRRGSGRYRPPVTEPVTVTLTSPLLADVIEREARDVSSTGLAIDIDPAFDLFARGMRFSEIVVHIGGEDFVARGRVRNLSYAGGRDAGLRAGIELEGIEEERRLRLADLIMRSRYPGLQDGGSTPFAELWGFFLESRFVYPEKAQALEPLMPEIRRTFTALAKPSDVYKSVLARDGDKLIGHVSGVRAYRNTWMSQHLCALNGHQAGALLNLGQAEYFGQNPDLSYFKITFRPDNRWPARVFGGFARNVADPRLSDLRTFDYLQIPLTWAPPVEPSIEVAEASMADLPLVERYFVANESGVLLRADDLTREGLGLGELNSRYRRIGLQRRRRVLLALRRNEPIAFALVEISSPGLNLSELLSAFRIFILPEAGSSSSSDAIAARAALVQAALPLYRQAGRPLAIGLGLLSERAEYQRIGLVATKQYSTWTCHRTLYQRFTDHVDRLVRTLAARAARQQRRKT